MEDLERRIEVGKEFIRRRITSLRLKADISEYQMSLELGQNRSYIQSISSGRALPSMTGFLNICDYFDITPLEFFELQSEESSIVKNINKKMNCLSIDDLKLLDSVLEHIIKNKNNKTSGH